MQPSVGRTVHYMLNEYDANAIEAQRAAVGALHHRGNVARAGDVCPMVIVRVWGDSDVSAVNGQLILDGTDSFWVTSKTQVAEDSDDKQGHWFAPPRV
jgi:hypothetical protein